MSGSFAQQHPWATSPFAHSPFGNAPIQFAAYGTSFAQPPLQHIVQSLLVVPQQLQQLLQLAQIQQQQVQYLLQSIPQQLQQLQQLQQFQQPQQQVFQPGFQSLTPHAFGIPQIPGSGPQPFGAQPGYLM